MKSYCSKILPILILLSFFFVVVFNKKGRMDETTGADAVSGVTETTGADAVNGVTETTAEETINPNDLAGDYVNQIRESLKKDQKWSDADCDFFTKNDICKNTLTNDVTQDPVCETFNKNCKLPESSITTYDQCMKELSKYTDSK